MKKPRQVIHHVTIRGIPIIVTDFEGSIAVPIVKRELEKDIYRIKKMEFVPGDQVIDIGAHVGLFSLYLAKRNPNIRIYAYEPVPDIYELFMANIRQNGVNNITPYNFAITGAGGEFRMSANLIDNSGGATGHLKDMAMDRRWHYIVQSRTLEDVFRDNQIEHCRLLKIDCEGTEYEILGNSSRYLEKVDFLSGEFHINNNLLSQGYSVEALLAHCRKHFSHRNLAIKCVRMAE